MVKKHARIGKIRLLAIDFIETTQFSSSFLCMQSRLEIACLMDFKMKEYQLQLKINLDKCAMIAYIETQQ